MSLPDAVLFDKDGTILPFAPFWTTWTRVFRDALAAAVDVDLTAGGLLDWPANTRTASHGSSLDVATMGDVRVRVAAMLRGGGVPDADARRIVATASDTADAVAGTPPGHRARARRPAARRRRWGPGPAGEARPGDARRGVHPARRRTGRRRVRRGQPRRRAGGPGGRVQPRDRVRARRCRAADVERGGGRDAATLRRPGPAVGRTTRGRRAQLTGDPHAATCPASAPPRRSPYLRRHAEGGIAVRGRYAVGRDAGGGAR